MLAEALQAEVDAYIAAHAAERDENGRRLVVRNSYHQPREVLTSAGAVEVTVPRVNDKRTDPDTGERKRFSSAILPPWARKTPKITEVLPLLYLHGLSSGDFVPALGQFLGSSAGLSPAVITRLTETEAQAVWRTSVAARCQRRASPAGRDLIQRSEHARLLARLETMPVIEQAKGIIMAQSHCRDAPAFDLLRRASQRSNVPVRELAAQIVPNTVQVAPEPFSKGTSAIKHG